MTFKMHAVRHRVHVASYQQRTGQQWSCLGAGAALPDFIHNSAVPQQMTSGTLVSSAMGSTGLAWGLAQYSQVPGFWLPVMMPLPDPVIWHSDVVCAHVLCQQQGTRGLRC